MAKYELRILNIHEDNEEPADDRFQQHYVDAICEDAVDLWQSSQVTLLIDGKRLFKAEMDGGPKDPHMAPARLKDWPWHKCEKLMPEVGQNIVVYNAESDFMCFGMLRPAEDNPTKDKGPFFHCHTHDGQEIGYFEPEFPNIY